MSCLLRNVKFRFLNLSIKNAETSLFTFYTTKVKNKLFVMPFFLNLHSFSAYLYSFCPPQIYFYNDFFHNTCFCLFISSKEIPYISCFFLQSLSVMFILCFHFDLIAISSILFRFFLFSLWHVILFHSCNNKKQYFHILQRSTFFTQIRMFQ